MNTSSAGTLFAASALVFFEAPSPPFISYWIFLLVNTLFKLFLLVAIMTTEYVSIVPSIILVLHILIFRLWHKLLEAKYTMLGMMAMVAIFTTNTLYMIVAFNIYFVPYAGWCIALLVWNVYYTHGGKDEEPILPQKIPPPLTAVPPRIRLFQPPPPRKK